MFLYHTNLSAENNKTDHDEWENVSAWILTLNTKAIEISAERFKHMKCDKNIFVWKCHNQHSWTLRIVQE